MPERTFLEAYMENYYDVMRRQEEERRKKDRFAIEFSESQPRGLYSSALSGLGNPQREYFSYRYNDIYNNYLEGLINQTRQGGMPTKKFSTFLGEYDFNEEYMKQPYMQRGGYQARSLTPRTRFLPY